MTNKEKQGKPYRIYDKSTRAWYEVSEHLYREYDRSRTALRKRMQYRGECYCPRSKWWLCDADCVGCEFRNQKGISLDEPMPNGIGTLGDYLPDEGQLLEDVLADKAELDALFARLAEVMPEAIVIGQLRQKGLSDAAIADILGIKRTTFLSRLKKVKEQLSREFPGWM